MLVSGTSGTGKTSISLFGLEMHLAASFKAISDFRQGDALPRGPAHRAAGDRFDLILCDMMMPLMTGMEFFTRLHALVPEQAERVVFMTGGAFTPRARDFLARLPNLRLEKPFDVDHILAMVTAHLKGWSSAAAEEAAGCGLRS